MLELYKIKKYILYLFLCIATFSFAQQKPMVKAEIDTTSIRIGEQFQYKIFVNGIKNVTIPKLKNLQGLEVIKEEKTDTLKNKLLKKYILTGFDSGAYYIPQQQIFIKNKAYLTDSLLINIVTIAVDTTKQKMFPIKAIKSEPIIFDDYKNYVWWAIAIIIVAGLLVYYFIFRKKKEEEEKENIPLLPPYEEAIQKLHQLDDKLLWQNNEVKKYYSELTEIIRAYIERELKISALESTTDELMENLISFNKKNVVTTKEIIKKLEELLEEADLVKFAKSKPLSHEIEEDRKDAENVINSLKTIIIEDDEVE